MEEIERIKIFTLIFSQQENGGCAEAATLLSCRVWLVFEVCDADAVTLVCPVQSE